MTKNVTSLDVIDSMIFDIGVQSYSNVNRIVTFHIDMSKPKSKLTPENLVTGEIEFNLKRNDENLTAAVRNTENEEMNCN